MAKKITSKDVASKASAALRDGRSSKRTKSIAASALSQREKKSNFASVKNRGFFLYIIHLISTLIIVCIFFITFLL